MEKRKINRIRKKSIRKRGKIENESVQKMQKKKKTNKQNNEE